MAMFTAPRFLVEAGHHRVRMGGGLHNGSSCVAGTLTGKILPPFAFQINEDPSFLCGLRVSPTHRWNHHHRVHHKLGGVS